MLRGMLHQNSYLLPQWPVPVGVGAACSIRTGGVSPAPFDSLNLGTHVGDEPKAVLHNRQRWAQQIGCRPVFREQVHGTQVTELHAGSADGIESDGAWTRQQGLACTVLVADCLPVLLCDADGGVVSAGHAGWRGLLGTQGVGVLERQARRHAGADVLAWLGPCIGPRAFEVGPEVLAAFVADNPAAAACFQAGAPGKWLADLAGLARQRLQALGITRIYGNDGTDAWCTVNNPSRYFSFRRERVCGRLAASIWRAGG